MFESALESGLSAAGVEVCLLGPMPTPAIAYLTQTLRACAGIVISASHNLFEDNGIKFFSAEGEKLPETMEIAIEKKMQEPFQTVKSALLGKATRIDDAPGRYIEFCKSTFPSLTRLSGLKIVVDCAHGATYYVAPNVFAELGADVIGMSTVPEAIALHHMRRKVIAISCITNLAAGVGKGVLDHEEVLLVAKKIQKTFSGLVKDFINVI
jgi:phosphoglucosamine mutase